MNDQPSTPRHYTREPWWVMVVGAIVMAWYPLRHYYSVQQHNTTGLSLPVLIAGMGLFGFVASSILVMRSHVRSPFLANLLLILGMVLAALGLSLMILGIYDSGIPSGPNRGE